MPNAFYYMCEKPKMLWTIEGRKFSAVKLRRSENDTNLYESFIAEASVESAFCQEDNTGLHVRPYNQWDNINMLTVARIVIAFMYHRRLSRGH